ALNQAICHSHEDSSTHRVFLDTPVPAVQDRRRGFGQRAVMHRNARRSLRRDTGGAFRPTRRSAGSDESLGQNKVLADGRERQENALGTSDGSVAALLRRARRAAKYHRERTAARDTARFAASRIPLGPELVAP